MKVVGIGASAGGLDAFRSFFSAMPADSGLAFVVVLHLPANRRSLLAEILQRWTAMPVREVEDGDEIRPNTVYVPPPHAITTYKDGHLNVTTPPEDGPREFRPIDGFFDTLGAGLGEDAVGIVLSGTGSDGALGLKAIRACSGLTIAQSFGDDQSDNVQHFEGMPAGAIATGAVDLVSAVQDMPGHLIRLLGTKLEAPAHADGSVAGTEELRLRICNLLRQRIGHDFVNYKEKTFLRRVHRRMQVRDVATLARYADLLDEDTSEALMLFRDLLIRVTSFFRDSEAFDVIERVVVPRLFADRHADHTVRVWVPGCSTGEEAYSLAILLREHMDTLRGPPRVQIFATDIDEPAIGTARLGRYPSVLLDGLTPDRRERFFRQSDTGYVVAKEIRDICTFSAHSLVRDPPFSRMDLVSCRNLLIYLDADLPAKVVPSFHYSLAPDGILILGISESTSRHEDLFTPLDKPARIFQRRNVRSPQIHLAKREARRLEHPERSDQPEARAVTDEAASPARQAINDQPKASSFLRQAADQAETGLTRLLRRVLPSGKRVEGSYETVSNALTATREELQSITEEHETAVEELRSANEELHSVNEELQSTNEELETSKEEIQSVNEELHTVNAQLQDKVEELDRVNSDLKNLFDSTQIATVFLDRQLVVRSFTPAIATIYNLIPGDIGRPLTDIASRLRYDTLGQDAAAVLKSLAPMERQVTNADGSAHFIMRILPYRDSHSVVSGTLVTFLDVTSVIRAEQHQRLLVDELNHRVKNMLTVVVSLASQTLRRADDLDTFGEAFLGRVHALSGSYALLSRENWMSVSLRDVVDEEMRPFGGNDMQRVVLEGSDVQLTPSAALALSMAVHELATNAVKYGALSQPEGQVNVSWKLTAGEVAEAGAPMKWLVLDWIEAGGPEVAPPTRNGFGTLLIQRGLSHELGGGATLDFQPGGLRARLCALLERVVSPQPDVSG